MPEGRSQNDDVEEREMEEGEGGEDVFEMLKTDHRHVQDLFTKFEDADKRARASIADDTLTALESPCDAGGGVGLPSHCRSD